MNELRHDADAKAAVSMRILENKLIEAIGTDTLRGLPVLLPGTSFHARRIFADGKYGTSAYLPRDHREVLVITSKGKLVFARSSHDHKAVETREPSDTELNADVIGPYIQAVQEVLDVHIIRTEKRMSSYQAAKALADRLTEAMGLRFR